LPLFSWRETLSMRPSVMRACRRAGGFMGERAAGLGPWAGVPECR
jgi:hypothetical protein